MKLVYLGRTQGYSGALDTRMWNVIAPELPGYDYKYGYPSFGLEGLKELGVLK